MALLDTARRKIIGKALSVQRGWPEEREKQLLQYAASGLSATQTAKIMKITRSSAISKARRLGAHFHSDDGSPAPPPKAPPKPRIIRPKPPSAIVASIERKRHARAESDVSRPSGDTVTIFDLESFMCRWPIGNPGEDGFGFCGRFALTSRYCETHSEIARSKADPRVVTKRVLAR